MVSDLTVIKHNQPRSKYPTHNSGITWRPWVHLSRTLTKNTQGLFYPVVRKPISNSTYGGGESGGGLQLGI